MSKVYGGKVAIFGDLHLSCTYEGQHKDYTRDCYETMGIITEKVKELKPSAVIFLGDIIGVNERNIRDRQFFLRVYLFFKSLNDLTGGNVYSVKGNHDKGDFSDFDFLIGAGLLKSIDYLDYYGIEDSDDVEIRFHLVNYGEEDRDLNILTQEGSSNVVLGHADFIIDGITNWYQHKGGVPIAKLKNFIGVDLIISGHIHNGSEEIFSTTIGGTDREIGLFYTGSPARTAERVDDCWYIVFEYADGFTNYEAFLMGLRPASEVFYPKEDFISDVDEETLVSNEENKMLTDIVKEILEGRMTNGDLFTQIRVVPHASDKVKDLACDYLRKAIELG